MKDIAHQPFEKQKECVISVLRGNQNLIEILQAMEKLDFPNWYVGAGAVAQTVWNHLHDYPLEKNIKDYDCIYYDADDLTVKSEKEKQTRLQRESEKDIKIDLTNEARIHLWFEKAFNEKVEQYSCSEDAICTWPTSATAIGITMVNKELELFAPYGLTDLLSMRYRPNSLAIRPDLYHRKFERYKNNWPKITYLG